jgi:hypothetical protein
LRNHPAALGALAVRPFTGDPRKMSELRCNVLATDSDDDMTSGGGIADSEDGAAVRRYFQEHLGAASALARR